MEGIQVRPKMIPPPSATGSVLGAAEKRVTVFELHKAGYSQQKIHEETGIGLGTISKYLRQELDILAAQQSDLVEEARNVELQRLDNLQLGIWEDACKGKLSAIDRVLRIMERRARLLGLDKPQITEHEVGDSFTEWVMAAQKAKGGNGPIPVNEPGADSTDSKVEG